VIDVLNEDGVLSYRLLVHAGSNHWGDVDVIPKAGQRCTFLAWDQGKPIVRQAIKSGLIGAVDLRMSEEAGDDRP